MRKFFLFACVCIASSLGFAQSLDFNQMVLTGDTAYAMSPPDSLGNSVFSQIGWSSDGKYLFGLRSDYISPLAMLDLKASGKAPSVKQELVVYNLSRHSTKVVFTSNFPSAQIGKVEWMYGTTSLFASIVETRTDPERSEETISTKRILRIDVSSGKADEVARLQLDDDNNIEYMLAPLVSAGLFMRQSVTREGPKQSPVLENTYTRLDSSGKLTDSMPASKSFYFAGWAEDGKTAAFTHIERSGEGKFIQSLHLYNLQANTLVNSPGHFENSRMGEITASLNGRAPKLPAPTIKEYVTPNSSLPINAVAAKGSGTTATASLTLKPYLLVSKDDKASSALIAGDVEKVVISPTLSGVAYISQGVAMVRPISELPRAIYVAALKADLKTKAIKNAKQVGTALIMHASDNDDTYIGGKADLRQELGPYLKDPSTLDGFVYTFGGGGLDQIESPADTVIGYTVGPGGRAELYADGHVKWRDDK